MKKKLYHLELKNENDPKKNHLIFGSIKALFFNRNDLGITIHYYNKYRNNPEKVDLDFFENKNCIIRRTHLRTVTNISQQQ